MDGVWSEESKLARWLDVELAALEAWAELGAVPADAVAEIRERAEPPSAERVAELERETQHDLAAFVDAVAEQVGPAGRWIHHGLTSSDVVDTALSLQVRDAGELLLAGLERAQEAVVGRAQRHRDDVCIGRTHGVHAEPTTFGLKLAGWAFELDRSRRRLTDALETMRVGKLSGAVGTYAATDPELERLPRERGRPAPPPRPPIRSSSGSPASGSASNPTRSRPRSCSATAMRSCWRHSHSSPHRWRSSRSRSATWRARRSARSRSRSARARRARRRCRTSATRWSRNASAGSRAWCARTRSSGSRTWRSGMSATSRTPPRSAS